LNKKLNPIQNKAISSGFEPPTTREFDTWLNESVPFHFRSRIEINPDIIKTQSNQNFRLKKLETNKKRINIPGHFTQPQNPKEEKNQLKHLRTI
jgi:hypothetical protein